jgi:hypothetical protein
MYILLSSQIYIILFIPGVCAQSCEREVVWSRSAAISADTAFTYIAEYISFLYRLSTAVYLYTTVDIRALYMLLVDISTYV